MALSSLASTVDQQVRSGNRDLAERGLIFWQQAADRILTGINGDPDRTIERRIWLGVKEGMVEELARLRAGTSPLPKD